MISRIREKSNQTVFSERLIEPEVLDHVPPEVARPNLADLVRINKRLGGHSVLRKALKAAIQTPGPFSLLDVGAASGDSARFISGVYPDATVTCLDYNATNLERAPRPKLIADAFNLPFAERSFDIVLCSLFLHHFQNFEAIELLRGFYRAARQALVVCDLERHVLPYLFLPATRPLFRWNDITVSDGLKSVRAAFKGDELKQVALAAGIRNPEVRVYRPAFRLTLVAKT